MRSSCTACRHIAARKSRRRSSTGRRAWSGKKRKIACTHKKRCWNISYAAASKPRNGVMIDHTGVNVTDIARSKAFYGAALAPLGYVAIMEFGDAVGFGVPP